MLYLMYYKDGFIKKFPLNKKRITIGRSRTNDIVLDDKRVSRRHCCVEVLEDSLSIFDLGSANGIIVNRSLIKEGKLLLNHSFGIGDTEFFFRKGEIKEFKVSKKLSAIINQLTESKRPTESGEEETLDSVSKSDKLLSALMEKALLIDDFQNYSKELSSHLPLVIQSGTLLLVQPLKQTVIFNHLGLSDQHIKKIAQMALRMDLSPVRKGKQELRIKAFTVSKRADSILVYIFDKKKEDQTGLHDFLLKIVGEIIHLFSSLSPIGDAVTDDTPFLYEDKDVIIIGKSLAMRKNVDIAKRIANKDKFVLIMGENGTGKELIARMIHNRSDRKKYIAINCAAIPSTLLESELFGYEVGAFTDARKRRIGKIEEASGGTLVLDEIADMPLDIQSKILRVIQERAINRLGGNELIAVDIRIISLTNRNLYQLIDAGDFREDLFFRLRVHELKIPPLRERPEDIPPLINYFARTYSRQNGISPAGFSEAAYDCFINYPWPGNIRELENEISRIMDIVENGELISKHHILEPIVQRAEDQSGIRAKAKEPLQKKISNLEREEIIRLLESNRWNKSKTARMLGMTYQGFLKKLKRLNIK